MPQPIEDFESWFNVFGTYNVDSESGKITVLGSCILKRSTRWLPYDFQAVTGSFDLEDGKFSTLQGCPSEVGGDFRLGQYKGVDLKGGPQSVGGNYSIMRNPQLTSLEGLASPIGGKLYIRYKPSLPLLRTLSAEKGVVFYDPGDPNLEHARKILNKYAGQGKRAMFDCQKELEDAGFEENARW